MNKNLVHILGIIILSILVGSFVTGFVMNKKHNKSLQELATKHKLEIENEIRLSIKRIKSRDSVIAELDSIIKKDSLKRRDLIRQILINNLLVEKRREEARKLTPDEKVTWLLNRYDSISN